MDGGTVVFILLLAVGFCFSLPMEDIEEDPAVELEHLVEPANDRHRGCHDMSLYWCRGYSSKCSLPSVYRYCPKTCGRCPDAGGWGAWTAYGPCSQSCHHGYQIRTRKCNNPLPSACQGPSMERRKCNEHVSCATQSVGSISALTIVDGVWTPWSSYTKCSKSCGTGTQSRNRTCINPSHPSALKRCPGPFRQHRPCNQHSCPVDGGWTSWSTFRQCSVSCGGGIQHKYRKCKNPPPQHGGKLCSGPFSMSRMCNTHPCAVDGQWSSWSAFGPCSKRCGGGKQYRSRACQNPAPSSSGKSCSGPSHQSKECNTQACAVHGQWSPWGAFGPCSKSCGGGKQYRSRTCNNPAPSSGGNSCPGPSHQWNACNAEACQVHGNWSPWSMFGPCSRSCGGGMTYRTRICNNPAPSGGGQSCQGIPQEVVQCNTHVCPVNGQWSQWSGFGSCSQTCGGGFKRRSRKCNNPAPASGGRHCSGASFQSVACNIHSCPASGGWSSWGHWGGCSRTCGAGGRQTRHRTCTNPPPTHGGKGCSGYSIQTRSCWNNVHCPQTGCRDIQNYEFCKYIMTSYRCWQYYGYCRKTCNACQYHRAY